MKKIIITLTFVCFALALSGQKPDFTGQYIEVLEPTEKFTTLLDSILVQDFKTRQRHQFKRFVDSLISENNQNEFDEKLNKIQSSRLLSETYGIIIEDNKFYCDTYWSYRSIPVLTDIKLIIYRGFYFAVDGESFDGLFETSERQIPAQRLADRLNFEFEEWKDYDGAWNYEYKDGKFIRIPTRYY